MQQATIDTPDIRLHDNIRYTQRWDVRVNAVSLTQLCVKMGARLQSRTYLNIEQDLKATALKRRTLGTLQVGCPFVQVVLYRELDVLVLEVNQESKRNFRVTDAVRQRLR